MRFVFLLLLVFFNMCRGGESDPKILALIIASDEQPVYRELQTVWRAYMHLDPEHVEAYFLKADPDLPVPYEVRGDVIWSKTSENYIPGILTKTLLSMECMLPRLHEFDYVLRTNLSSFYIFPRLLDYVKTLPATHSCYALPYYIHTLVFPSGSGFLLSPDLVEMLLARQTELDYLYPDDMAIGLFLQKENIPINFSPRTDYTTLDHWHKFGDQIPPDAFHIRAKNDDPGKRLTDEIYIQKELVKMFYGEKSQK